MRRVTLLIAVVATATMIAAGVAIAAVIDGGIGDDVLTGTDSLDTIKGYGGNDTVFGAAGNDEIDGGEGDDTLYGNDEDQTIGGDDTIYGASGSDNLLGGDGADGLHGDDGNDWIWDGSLRDSSVDTITGGAGDDKVRAANGQSADDAIACGDGQDEVWADSADNVATDCEVVHEDPSQAGVKFAKPLQVEEAVRLTSQYGDEIDMLQSEFTAGTPMTDGYVPETQETAAEMSANIEQQRLSAFQDIVTTAEKLRTPEEQTAIKSELDAMKTALANNDAGQITVSEITISGDLEDLQALNAESTLATETGEAVASVDVVNTEQLAEEEVAEAAESPTSGMTTEEAAVADPDDGSMANLDEIIEETPTNPGAPEPGYEETSGGTYSTEAGTWWPNKGYSTVGKSSRYPGRVFSLQDFRWANKCCFTGGYEHDFKLYKGPAGTYLSENVTESNWPRVRCYPKNAYIFTDLPRSGQVYFDTNATWRFARCAKKERAFTIGMLYPGYARSGVWYYTYFATPPGRDQKDEALLEAEQTDRYCGGGSTNRSKAWCANGRLGNWDRNLVDENTYRIDGTDSDKRWYDVPGRRKWVE